MSFGQRIVRPPGELVVSIQRPINRFGAHLTLAAKEGGQYWVGQVMEGGHLLYSPIDSATEHAPTAQLDDQELIAVRRALNADPIQAPEDYMAVHLKDATTTRDRLLALVEQAWADRLGG